MHDAGYLKDLKHANYGNETVLRSSNNYNYYLIGYSLLIIFVFSEINYRIITKDCVYSSLL